MTQYFRAVVTWLCLCCLAVAGGSPAGARTQDLPTRMLENARGNLRDKRYADGVKALEQVVAQNPNTAVAADALLVRFTAFRPSLGLLAVDVSGPAGINVIAADVSAKVQAAGLVPGDRIVAVNGKKIDGVAALNGVLATLGAKDPLSLEVLHNTRRRRSTCPCSNNRAPSISATSRCCSTRCWSISATSSPSPRIPRPSRCCA